MRLVRETGTFVTPPKLNPPMSHLSQEERNQIGVLLDGRCSLKEIGRCLRRPHSTIAREILRHRRELDIGAAGRPTNRCALREICRHSQVCGEAGCRRASCRNCGRCNAVCPDYRERGCARLEAPPYVCNGCAERPLCVLRKRVYLPAPAQTAYEDTLRGVRSGTRLDEATLAAMDRLLHEGLAMGQSVHHMMAAFPAAFPVSEKTVYRLVNRGLLPLTRRVDLPEAVRRRPRGRGCVERPAPVRRGDGRGYQDYLRHLEQFPGQSVVELDSVVGRVGGKCLLTMNFNFCGMMLMFLRPRNDAQSVVECIDLLERRPGPDLFRRLFQVALTDNGGEFAQAERMETDAAGARRIGRLFFCDPYSSWQKGRVENNHLNLRRIIPKGTSMDALTQEDVNLVASHVNSMLRAEYNNVPAAAAFARAVGQDVMERLGIALVAPGRVNLTPALLAGRLDP